MSQSEPKGTIRADVSDEAVAAALRAVEGHGEDATIVLDVEGDAAGDTAAGTPEAGTPEAGDTGAAPSSRGATVYEILTDEPAAGGDELEALREELRQKDLLLEEAARQSREMMARLQDANELRLRAAADLDNFKKRAQREKEDVQRFGIERLLGELIPVLDNFDRAIAHGSAGADVASFSTGVEMTRKLFEDTLGKFGVKAFSAVGEAFDPHRHEAIQQLPHEEHPAGTVVQELVRGYLLHDRLVRAAMVAVSSGPADEGPSED